MCQRLLFLLALVAAVAFAAANDQESGISSDGTLPNAHGGTELMRRGLEARLPQIFLDTFSLSSSRVRELPPGKKHVLWLHDLPEDPESQRLKDPSFRNQFALIVFVSEWQKRRYEEYYGIDFGHQAVVLRNAIRPFGNKDIPKPRDGPIRLIYHTTPHRGLQILIPAFFELYKKHGSNIHLDVYSSFKIYGWEQRDEPYRQLFDQCREHPGCTYHGSVPNASVREALAKSHIFAYPNTWQETSCIAAIEAMSAGVEVVTSQHAALPETLGNGRFGLTYPFKQEFMEHAVSFLQAMDHAITTYWEPEYEQRRRHMALFAANAYDWGVAGWSAGGRMEEWIRVLSMRMPEFDTIPRRSGFAPDERFSEALFVAAKRREMRGEIPAALEVYRRALEAHPTSALVSLALGLLEISLPGTEQSGIERLGAATVPGNNLVPPPEEDSIATYGASIRASYWYSQRHYEEETRSALERAYASDYPHDDCWAMYRATYMAHVPMTEEESRRNIALYHQRLDELIARADRLICDNMKNLNSPFSVAYYDLGFRDELEKWTKLYMLAYQSSLVVTAPSLRHEESSLQRRPAESITKEKPLRIGFVSSFFTPESSIWGSFGKTVNTLQVNPLFDVDMIYYPRSEITPAGRDLSLNPETNLYLSQFSISPHDPNRQRARAEIVARRYDVLVYLDLWMTIEMNELAVAKLAPIQMVTHGHPLTSGIPKHVMDYFISWSAAELPDPKAAQDFYTEELILLPGDKPWEYYEPRTSNGTSNLHNGGDFSHYTRESLSRAVLNHDEKAAAVLRDPGSVVYFCAQATFKLHIAFDKILSEIQRLDPKAVIVLIELKDELSHIHTKMKKRLEENSGVDMNRVIFVPRMKHDHLMGMYQNADVVLDSLYFGGDTTSREAFETGAPIITLPHKTIGQRWTQAYYKMMGIEDFIVRDTDHYAQLAVEVANRSPEAKTQLRERIKRSAHEHLFRRTDGAQYWADMFLDVATRPRRWRWNDEKLQELEDSNRDEL